MRIELIETFARLEDVRPDWEAAYLADDEAHYFVSWTFMAQVFAQMETGWRVVAVRPDQEGSAFVAFLPLRVSAYLSKSQRLFCNTYDAAGAAFWADYTGLVCARAHDSQAIPALAGHLKSMPWAELELRNLLMSDRRQQLFLRAFEADVFKATIHAAARNKDNINNDVCPYIDLPDSFEAFLQNILGKNARPKMRRVLRLLETSDQFRVTIADASSYARDIEITLAFWREKWAARKGSRIGSQVRRFRRILHAAAARNVLFLPVLWRGETPLGALGHFIDRDKKALLYKLAGRNDAFKTPPPGVTLHAYSIRWAIQNGFKTYEFLRGDEPFKFTYGATANRRIQTCVIRTQSRRNASGALDPLSIPEVLDLATQYKEGGAVRKAAVGFRQILEVSPGHPIAAFLAGRLERPRPSETAEDLDA